MNVLTFRFWNFSYSDGTSVAARLKNDFQFTNVYCMEKTGDAEKVQKTWGAGNLVFLDNYRDYKNLKLFDLDVCDMPPLSRETIERLSLERCRLYSLHRDETLKYRELDKVIMTFCRYWSYVLDKLSIGLVLFNGAPHAIHTYSLYAVCKIRNIKLFYVGRACIPGYSFCHDDIFEQFGRLKTAYLKAIEAGGPYELSEYMQKSYAEKMEKDAYKVPDSYKMSTRVKEDTQEKLRLKTRLRQWMLRNYYRLHGTTRDYCLDKKAIAEKTDKYYRKLSCKADYSKRYIYVPLQMQPELSTSPLGNVYVNLLLMVETVAYCIKDTDIMLYVKEHGSQTEAFRLSRRELYDDLLKLPNVRLINKEEDSYKLQDGSIATASCTGMVIMESLFKFKPVLVFGSHINNLAPNAYVVSDVESCKAALDDILSGNFSIGEREKNAFLYAMEQSCIHGFVRSEHAEEFGLSRDESAENTYLELKERIGEWLEDEGLK